MAEVLPPHGAGAAAGAPDPKMCSNGQCESNCRFTQTVLLGDRKMSIAQKPFTAANKYIVEFASHPKWLVYYDGPQDDWVCRSCKHMISVHPEGSPQRFSRTSAGASGGSEMSARSRDSAATSGGSAQDAFEPWTGTGSADQALLVLRPPLRHRLFRITVEHRTVAYAAMAIGEQANEDAVVPPPVFAMILWLLQFRSVNFLE